MGRRRAPLHRLHGATRVREPRGASFAAVHRGVTTAPRSPDLVREVERSGDGGDCTETPPWLGRFREVSAALPRERAGQVRVSSAPDRDRSANREHESSPDRTPIATVMLKREQVRFTVSFGERSRPRKRSRGEMRCESSI
jgi:hypothetical protein